MQARVWGRGLQTAGQGRAAGQRGRGRSDRRPVWPSSWSRLVAAPAVAETPFFLFVASMKWEGRRLSSKSVTSMVSR